MDEQLRRQCHKYDQLHDDLERHIPIRKLALYSAAGGIDRRRTLPVVLDVGTNNERLLADPLYLGWRHERVSGAAYARFIDCFVSTVKSRFPVSSAPGRPGQASPP